MPRASEKAVPEKLGRQTPTAAVVLPYTCCLTAILYS